MKTDKRNHRRLKPKGLHAGVAFDNSNREHTLEAEILDISYSGIRVKLKEPIALKISGPVKINMILPESGTPFSVHGILKHQNNDVECGIHYIAHVEGSIDDLMFECIELDNSTVLIKTA